MDDPLERLVKATADAAVAFYKDRAGTDGFDEDAHNFFRIENLDSEFRKFLRQQSSKYRRGRIRVGSDCVGERAGGNERLGSELTPILVGQETRLARPEARTRNLPHTTT